MQIYFPYKHNINLFKSLGVHLGHKLGPYITFPSLSIGGSRLFSSRMERANNLVQLDNGYAYIVRNLSAPNILNHFEKLLNTPRLQLMNMCFHSYAHVLTAIMNQELLLQNQHHQICNIANQKQRLVIWMLQYFPSLSARWMDPLGGKSHFINRGSDLNFQMPTGHRIYCGVIRSL